MAGKEWEHKCEEMPEDSLFYKVDFCDSASFVLEAYKKEYFTRTVLNGFKYCPYCGEKVVNDE